MLKMTTSRGETVRFCREPKRNGGELLAVFSVNGDGSFRYTLNCDGYGHVSAAYIRNLRTASESDRPEAERMLARINADSEYAASLSAPRECRLERTSLGGGVICAECGDECECYVCAE